MQSVENSSFFSLCKILISILATWLRIQCSSKYSWGKKKTVPKCWILSHPQSFTSFSRSRRKENRAVQRWFLYQKQFSFLLIALCTWSLHTLGPAPAAAGLPQTPIIPRRIKRNILQSALGMQPLSDCCAFAFTEAFPELWLLQMIPEGILHRV